VLWRALRFIAGAAAGFLVWWYGTLFYDGALAAAAEQLLRFDQRLCNAHLIADERKIEAIPHLCVGPKVTIPADQLTYNVILLTALFAMRWRSIASFLASLFVVAMTHVLSVVLSLESTYAGRMGTWSESHYSELEAHIWVAAEFWWRLVGMFAIVFACWWLTQAPIFPTARASGGRRPTRAAERGRR
jgi:hypothetical protein